MKKVKEFMRVCLVAGCMLALTACGSTSTEQTTTSNDSEVVQSTVVEEETVAKADSAEETDKIVIVDQLGKTIDFDGVPQRVATTIMPFPYIYYAVVGNNDNLIGCNPSSIVAYENSALKYMYPELANANTSFVDTSFVVNVEEVL